MRKKVRVTLCAGILIFLAAAFGGYFGLAGYYADGFSYGTWVNGVYCTGKTVEEVNEELRKGFTESVVEISFEDGETKQIRLQDISYTVDYVKPLAQLMEFQNPNLWILNVKNGKKNAVTADIAFDENALLKQLKEIPLVKQTEKNKTRSVEIIKTKQGYRLLDEKKHVLDTELFFSKVKEELQNGKYRINIEEECYKDIPLTAGEEKLYTLWDKIERFQDCKIRYDMGDTIVPIDAGVVCEWITLTEEGGFALDEEGNLITDEEKIKEFIEDLAKQYDTLGSTRSFKATRGDEIEVEGGTYGSKLNQKSEIAYLTEAFAEGIAETHVPSYTQEAYVRGKEDIGETYIEIDMTEQMMYYYVQGELYVETPIVTGNMVRRMSTPEGTCFVYAKQESRVLRGADYASFVNFWVPVRGNIGIHDAPWRSKFGGEIYKSGGSHGCINTPYDEMKKIYEHVEIGTPVVMFY